MKNYRETYVRRAEIAQIILLHQLYLQPGSHDLIFQGGTAIRWCYGGSRFSEDLDFVTPLDCEAVRMLLARALKGAGKVMIPHFGVGSLTLTEKSARAEALKFFADFRPEAAREKISVKLEFEGIAGGMRPQTKNHVLSELSTVAFLIRDGEFRVPRPHAVAVAETPEEVLSDKIRSLLERRYLKGRDVYDLWYLCSVMNVPVDVALVKRKFEMYRAAFVARRDIGYFVRLTRDHRRELQQAIDQDLSRFLPPEVLAVHKAERYTRFLEALETLFADLKKKGVRLP